MDRRIFVPQRLAWFLRLAPAKGTDVKPNTTALSKLARAIIQIAGAILLVLGVEAVTNGAQFSAWLLLPTGGWLFGRSMGA
jgi:hypothetical protein